MMLLTASPVRLKPPTPGWRTAWERDCEDSSSQVMPTPADIHAPVPAPPITAASLTSSSLPPIWGRTTPRSFPIYHMPVRRPWPQGYKFAPATATGSVWLPPVPLTQPWQSISWQRAHAFALTGVIPSTYKRWLTLQEPISSLPWTETQRPLPLALQGGYGKVPNNFGAPVASLQLPLGGHKHAHVKLVLQLPCLFLSWHGQQAEVPTLPLSHVTLDKAPDFSEPCRCPHLQNGNKPLSETV